MENPLTRAIVCPIIVGRTAELTALRLLIDRTRSGQGQVALVCGEAGIGKSRLVDEAKAYAAAQNFLVLQGSCFQVDSSYPYAPLLDLLRASAAPTPNAPDPDPIVLEFARLLPEAVYALDDFLVYAYYGHKREHSAQIAAFRDRLL